MSSQADQLNREQYDASLALISQTIRDTMNTHPGVDTEYFAWLLQKNEQARRANLVQLATWTPLNVKQ